jgi:hypothetical protein
VSKQLTVTNFLPRTPSSLSRKNTKIFFHYEEEAKEQIQQRASNNHHYMLLLLMGKQCELNFTGFSLHSDAHSGERVNGISRTQTICPTGSGAETETEAEEESLLIRKSFAPRTKAQMRNSNKAQIIPKAKISHKRRIKSWERALR